MASIMASTTDDSFVYQPPLAEVVTHFRSTPWTMKLFSDPTLQPFTNESRNVQLTHTGSTFIGRTLATDDTIAAWQSFHKTAPSGSSKVETITILKIGSGVNGHIDTCHGGFVGLVMDEVIGLAADYVRPKDKSTMTAYLKVDYKKPIPTPGVVLCRAWIEKIEGRKMFGKGTVEDSEGGVFATGEALFIAVAKVTAQVKL